MAAAMLSQQARENHEGRHKKPAIPKNGGSFRKRQI